MIYACPSHLIMSRSLSLDRSLALLLDGNRHTSQSAVAPFAVWKPRTTPTMTQTIHSFRQWRRAHIQCRIENLYQVYSTVYPEKTWYTPGIYLVYIFKMSYIWYIPEIYLVYTWSLLNNLKWLSLSHNQITHLSLSIGLLPALQTVNLEQNEMEEFGDALLGLKRC